MMNVIRRSTVSLLILISLALAEISTATPLEKFSEQDIQLAQGPAKAKLSVRVSAGEISVADSLTLTIEVSKPSGTTVQLPSFSELGFATEFTERSQRFRLTDISAMETSTLADGRILQHQSYTLEPWLSGDYAILPIMVPFYSEEAPNDATKARENAVPNPRIPLFSLMTDGIRIKVSPLPNERRQLSPLFGQADLNQIGLIKKERRIEDKSDEELRREKEDQKETKMALREKNFPWWVIWLLLSLMVIIPAVWLVSQKKVKQFFSKKVTPPHIKASQSFAALKEKNLIQKGLIKEFYYELSFILREYIGGRFNIFADRQTTEEFFYELLNNNPFDSMAEQILRNFSEKADTVKYSLFRPDCTQAEESLNIALSFVENTAEKE